MVGPIGEMLGVDRVVATRMVGRRRPLHRRDRVLRLRREQGRGDARAGRRGRLRPGRLLRLQRLGHRPADAGGGRPPDRGQPRPRAAQGGAERGWPVLRVHPPGHPAVPLRPRPDAGGDRRRRGRRRGRGRAGLVRPAARPAGSLGRRPPGHPCCRPRSRRSPRPAAVGAAAPERSRPASAAEQALADGQALGGARARSPGRSAPASRRRRPAPGRGTRPAPRRRRRGPVRRSRPRAPRPPSGPARG